MQTFPGTQHVLILEYTWFMGLTNPLMFLFDCSIDQLEPYIDDFYD